MEFLQQRFAFERLAAARVVDVRSYTSSGPRFFGKK